MPQSLSTINISLPKKLRRQVDRKIARDSYGSASEYLRELIRRDLRGEASARVDELLLDGLHSGSPRPVTESFWRALKAKAKRASRRRA